MADEKKIDPGDPFASFRGALDDLFGAVRPQKADVSLALSISLAEAAHGASRPISRERSTRCAACAGLGGQQGAERSACEACSGTGETRAQSKLELKIPPGVADGSVLRLAGQGDERGQGPGDLYVTIEVAPHPTLERVGDDLHARVRFDAERAARGGTLIVPWLEGSARVPMPAGSRPGDALRLPGWGCVKLGAAYAPPPVSGGAPYRTAAATRGDLIVTLVELGALAAAYRTLGLDASASRADVEAAYRRLALAHRPDRHPEREDAPARFEKIHAAHAEITRVVDDAMPGASSTRALAIVSSVLALAAGLAYWILR